ncbi:hypothetical protein EIP86_009332 [Pleurotus ostreatoroseus]|nr:hypothetical protein EIP86_009332 [Pleurotus ostreatoroseus]
MSPLSARKLPPSPALTPPPKGLAPRGACTCSKRCPVHLVSINEIDQRSLSGNTPPPSLMTDSDMESDKENVPVILATAATAASAASTSGLRHQLSAMNISLAYDTCCTYTLSDSSSRADAGDVDDADNANDSQHATYIDDECPATPLRLSGVVDATERTVDQPPPPEISPVCILVSGRDTDIGAQVFCGAFSSSDLIAKLTQDVPDQIHQVYPVFSDGWTVWKEGWERGIFRAQVHPSSIWRPVVSVEEVNRRLFEREKSITNAVPTEHPATNNTFVWPAQPAVDEEDEETYSVTFIVIKGRAPGVWYTE